MLFDVIEMANAIALMSVNKWKRKADYPERFQGKSYFL